MAGKGKDAAERRSTDPVGDNRLQCTLERTFTGAYDTLDFLENEWPLRHGERHERAVKTCRRALNGLMPAVIAREAFLAACLEAGMPTVITPLKTKARSHPVRPARLAGT